MTLICLKSVIIFLQSLFLHLQLLHCSVFPEIIVSLMFCTASD